LAGTNLTTEAVANLVRGGESIDDIAHEYDLSREFIDAARSYENRIAA